MVPVPTDAPRYAPLFCEENVWWLARDAVASGARAEVAIVSNATRSVAVWAQRAAPSRDAAVVWDYHVVLGVLSEARWAVWDLDCALGAPLSAERWLDASFERDAAAHLRPRFRVIEAAEYVRTFSSDRSHMRGADGRWLAPPPDWAPIGAGQPTLQRLLDLDEPLVGERMDLDALRLRWRAAT